MAKGKKYQISLDGQTLNRTDMNDALAQSNAAEDNAYSAIIQPPLWAGVHRYVQPPLAGYLVASNGVGSVVVAACTVAIGPLAAGEVSVVTAALPTTTYSPTAGSGSGSTARYDLIYATVTLNVPSTPTTRKVKNPSSKVVSTASISTSTSNTVTVSAVVGTESSTTPALPATPADGVNTYVIPLAYVRIPGTFTNVSTVGNGDIYEVAPVLTLPSAVRPFNALSSIPNPAEDIGIRNGTPARRRFMPAVMAGEVRRMGSFSAIAAGLPAGTIIDNSIDWRNRIFRGTFQVSNIATETVSWISGPTVGIPSSDTSIGGGNVTGVFAGQSFYAEASGRKAAMHLSSNSLTFAGSDWVEIYVDSSGNLVWNKSGNWNAMCFFWLEASDQFVNNF